jgi:hypothetical protein
MATPTKKKVAERDKRTERVYKKPTKTPPRKRATKEATRPRETPATPQKKRVAERDKRTERVYRKPVGAPPRKPVEKVTPRPEGGPTPMIRPGVGPVAQLSSQAAHTYGMTPKAYNELASIPTSIEHSTGDDEIGTPGYYIDPTNPGGERIRLLYDEPGYNNPGILAHEQAHAWQYRSGMNPGDNAPPREHPEFNRVVQDWAASNPDSPAGALHDYYGTLENESPSGSLEWHANLLNLAPTNNRQDWPDEVRPYYSGFLQGMDRLQDGQPTPVRKWR